MNTNYDVFLSFKNLNSDGKFSKDSILAKKIYDFFTSRGLNVFFSNVSLEMLGIAAYQKTIDNVLDAAKILIAVGTSRENLESKWVRYEWSSFYNDILSEIKPNGRLFGYVDNLDVRSLPRILRQNQVITHQSGSLNCLYNFVSNALGINPLDHKKVSAPPKSHIVRLKICSICNEQFDPIYPTTCSYHPEKPTNIYHLGPRDDYEEVWKFPCCGMIVIGAVNKEGWDVTPKQTPGCIVGEHKK